MQKRKRIFTKRLVLLSAVFSALISALLIYLATDTFAFTAPDTSAEVTVDRVLTPKETAQLLKDSSLIKSKLWFLTYTRLRGKTPCPSPDTYDIPYSAGYDGICRILTYGSEREHTQVRVSIPEGETVEGIARILCDKYGICKREDFLYAVQNADFSKYGFIKELEGKTDNRKYRLEGYLYPDTYCFFSDSSPEEMIDRMLSNFEKKLDGKYLAACREKGVTLDQALTLASVIMREGKSVSDYPKISSVFHNRLKSGRFQRRLQSDATLVYALGREMTSEDKSLDTPYNTYLYGGLPPSPICCPDLNAVAYALYPSETDLYYFVTKSDGTVLYARDYQTHLQNIKKAAKG